MKQILSITSMLIVGLAVLTGCQESREEIKTCKLKQKCEKKTEQKPKTARRIFSDKIGMKWIGNGVCYSAFREGQHPQWGPYPTPEQIREDLHIIKKHWQMIRLYATGEFAGTVLKIIKEEEIPMRVMIGAWIVPEAKYDDKGNLLEKLPNAVASNQEQVMQAIHFANSYPGIVSAISVGNETMVYWSDHKVKPEIMIQYIRQARDGSKVPVTTADVWSFWLSDESSPVVKEVDFVLLHLYAMWTGVVLEDALDWTKDIYGQVVARHPGVKVVIGETGWATKKMNEGFQAEMIKGKPGEKQQKIFIDAYLKWTTENKIDNFLFEAFDEPWKGGDHPDEVEKHWGVYNVDRTPKLVMKKK